MSRIVRRQRTGAGFLFARFARVALFAFALAATTLAAQSEPPAPRAIAHVLDRIHEGSARSVILDSKPLRARLELDGIEPERSEAEGRVRQWQVDLAIARAGGQPLPPVVSRGGAPIEGATVEVIPARVERRFYREPVFKDVRHVNDARGNRYGLVSEPGDVHFDVDVPSHPCRLELQLRIHGTKEQASGVEPPLVKVLANDQPIGELEPMSSLREVPWSFDLPGAGPTRVTLRVSRVVPEKGRMVALLWHAVAARDGRDRVRIATPQPERGLVLEYAARAPEPVVLLFGSKGPDDQPETITVPAQLVPGRIGIVVGEPQIFEVAIDGKPIASTGTKRANELVFEFDDLGTHSITVRGEKKLRGSVWLVQPRALYAALNDPVASLTNPVPLVRGLDGVPGHPLERHFMLFGDTRRALLAPPGSEISIPVTLEPGDEIEYAIGTATLREESLPRGPIGFSIELVTADGVVHDLDQHSIPKRRRTRWEERFCTSPQGYRGEARFVVKTWATGNAPFSSSDVMLAFAEPTIVRRTGPARPNLLIYLIDTLRADHCSPWGYSRDTTPFLSELAAEGILFENAYAQAPWTRPSVATLFTSQLTYFHNASKTTGLAPALLTLAERARAAGYATGGFIANAHVHGSSLNFEQGFSTFEAIEKTKRREDSRAAEVSKSGLDWLDKNEGRPFFLYLHTIDPHAPYDPVDTRGIWSGGYDGPIVSARTNAHDLSRLVKPTKDSPAIPLAPEDLQQVIDLYDEEILSNDRELARLCATLKERGLWDSTILVVVSDHGEEFYEHQGFGHGQNLWEELLRVPLIVKPDRRDGNAPGVRVTPRVRVMDVLPTLLQRMGIDDVADCMGESLLAAFTGDEVPDDLPVIAEEYPDRVTLIYNDKKWISYGAKSRKPQQWLFDLAVDPHEQDDLSARQPDRAKQMAENLAAIFRKYHERFTPVAGLAENLSPEDQARLEAIGYAQGGDDETGEPPPPVESMEDEELEEDALEEPAPEAPAPAKRGRGRRRGDG